MLINYWELASTVTVFSVLNTGRGSATGLYTTLNPPYMITDITSCNNSYGIVRNTDCYILILYTHTLKKTHALKM